MRKLLAAAGVFVAGAAGAQAASLADIDYDSLTLTRTSLSAGQAKGVSNGVGYTFTGSYYGPFTGTTAYNDLPAGNQIFPDLHVGTGWTITFDDPITSLLVAMRNDNNPGGMGINFGVTASDSVDTVGAAPDYRVQDLGGALVLFEFGKAVTSVTNVIPSASDGFDISFFANPVTAVPLPASSLLLLGGLGGLGLLRRKA